MSRPRSPHHAPHLTPGLTSGVVPGLWALIAVLLAGLVIAALLGSTGMSGRDQAGAPLAPVSAGHVGR